MEEVVEGAAARARRQNVSPQTWDPNYASYLLWELLPGGSSTSPSHIGLTVAGVIIAAELATSRSYDSSVVKAETVDDERDRFTVYPASSSDQLFIRGGFQRRPGAMQRLGPLRRRGPTPPRRSSQRFRKLPK